MRFCVHANDLSSFKEALDSHCDGVRFGSEFCEALLPGMEELREAYRQAQQAGKEFTYVTSRMSNAAIEKARDQLAFLNDQEGVGVVFNDLGMLNVLQRYPNLHPHLGRNLLLVPARSPWVKQHLRREDLSLRRREWLRRLFSSTSLNYRPTIALYRRFGCQRADVDWIPRIFPALAFLTENGLRLSVHLHLVPATFTRKCHMARFLGETSLEECSKPCLRRAFLLRNEAFGMQLYLLGNAAFRLMESTPEGVGELERYGVYELVLTMNPLTGIDSAEKIDQVISSLGLP